MINAGQAVVGKTISAEKFRSQKRSGSNEKHFLSGSPHFQPKTLWRAEREGNVFIYFGVLD